MTLRFAMVLALAGCGRTDAEHVRGREGTTCYPNRTCDAGLFCTTDLLCVSLAAEWCPFAGGELVLNGDPTLEGNRLRITDGGINQASSAFCRSRVVVSQFATEFSVHMPLAVADGMMFVVQNQGLRALGDSGGGLGFGGDPDGPVGKPYIDFSVGVKLDVYDNVGEGPSSTGVYLNGADPGVPATDLRPAGIDLHSTNVFRVGVTYAGGVLDIAITDTETGTSFRETHTLDLPSVIADNLAWTGFTGGTGQQGAIIDVFDWTFGAP